MRALLLAALLLLPAPPAGEERAFLEIEVPQRAVFVREAIPVRLRIGLDERFLREHGVRTSLQRLDFPVQVRAPWLRGVPGAAMREESAAAGTLRTLGLEDEAAEVPVAATVTRDGRAFTVLEVSRVLVADRPGELTLPEATLSFAWADRIAEDAFGGGRAEGRHDETVRCEPRILRVLPLPAEGRPASFSGAVGRFTVEAEAGASEVRAGESLRLVLRVQGEGNLDGIDPPHLDDLPGFHVYGRIDGGSGTRRTFAYDLAPLEATVSGIPAIPFTFFEPGESPGYRVARTDPLPLRVLAGAAATPAPATPAEDSGPGALRLALAAVTAVLVLVAIRRWRRGTTGPSPSARLRAAADAVRAQAVPTGADLPGAFAAFLGAILDRPASAATDPDLAARLREAGVPADPAARAAAAMDRLAAARFGGGAPSTEDDHAALLALVEELEHPPR